jgi:protoporphyrinogen oxidase
MKIGIIGAGFTGLAAGLKLAEEGYQITIFEKEREPGGQAGGFKKIGWLWPLEKHYHHFFVSDNSIKELAKKVGQKIIFKRPKSSVFLDQDIYQLDSPISLLSFPKLTVIDRLRAGLVILYLKLTPFWQPMEKIKVVDFIKSTMGSNAWRVLWEPLFDKKFGAYKDGVPASWFWARIKKRSTSLGYPQGSFMEFAKKTAKKIMASGGSIHYGAEVRRIVKKNRGFSVEVSGRLYSFDKIICTLPSPLFLEMTKNSASEYRKNLANIKSLGVVDLVLVLKRKFLRESYWLNVNERKFPFCAVVEHTNFISPKTYGGNFIVYVGNYLPNGHRYFTLGAGELLREFFPYLTQINPNFKKSWVKKAFIFKEKYAQPVPLLNYSKYLPSCLTPTLGLYLANMEQVYPWDRGVNYAVELGERVADLCLIDSKK